VINVGGISVTAILDSVVHVVPKQAYDSMSAVDWSRHAALLDDEGFLRITPDGYVVRSADLAILVDADVGPDDRQRRGAAPRETRGTGPPFNLPGVLIRL